MSRIPDMDPDERGPEDFTPLRPGPGGERSMSDPVSPPRGERSAPPWNACVEPGCRHNGCGPKVRAWGNFGSRYICKESGCTHCDCAAKRRAEADRQPFGVFYTGPALPQHTVFADGTPSGAPMRAVEDPPGFWRIVPLEGTASVDEVLEGTSRTAAPSMAERDGADRARTRLGGQK